MTEVASVPDSNYRPTTIKAYVFYSIGLIVFLFVIEDLIGWINGGGIFSIFAADHAIVAGARFIDVDSNAPRVPFAVILCPIVFGLGAFLNADMSKRWQSGVIIIALIAGAFILDDIYGHRIITHFMAVNGYDRCPARDHEVGNGKGRVWLDAYVRSPDDCRPR